MPRLLFKNKRMWKYLIILFLLLPVGADLSAQPDTDNEASRFARIKAAKEAFFREELPLTETEAAAFFPIYWNFDKEIRQFHHGRHGHRGQEEEVLTEEAALNQLRENRQNRQRMSELHDKAETAYLKVLPAVKVIRIDRTEREFREKLLRRLKQSGRGGKN